jgi:PAS domain S-box-containing protein
MKKNENQPADAAELRRRAEDRLREKQKSPRPEAGDERTAEATARLVHELQVHQIELEMQNEELRQMTARAGALTAQYFDLYEFAPTGYLTLDPEGAIRQVNLAGARILGVGRSQLVNRRLGLFVAEGDRRAFSDFLQRVFASQAKESCEVTLPQAGPHPLTVRIEGTRSTEGQECRAVLFDVTERRRTENAMQESEEQFRAMFEIASIGMAQADTQSGQFLRVNQKMCAITGYSAAELLRMRLSEITHPDDRQKDWEEFGRVVRGEAPDYHLEKRYLRKDGAVIWVSANMTVIRDAAGQPVRTMATIEDITERKRAEASHARLVTAVEQSAETVVITDVNGTILYANPAFETTSGYTRKAAIGRILPPDVDHPGPRRCLEWPSQQQEEGRHALRGGRHHLARARRRGQGRQLRRGQARCHPRSATRSPTAPGAKDGGGRPACRRGGARFQQHAGRHPRQC